MNRPKLDVSRLVCVLLCLAGAVGLFREQAGAPGAAAPPPAGPADGGASDYLPLPPLADAPQPYRLSTLVPVPLPEDEWLPEAQTPAQARLLPSDRAGRLVQRPDVDLPMVAFEAPAAPPLPPMIAGPLAHELLADPARLPIMAENPRPDPDRPDLETDPTLDAGLRAMLEVMPEMRQNPAPFLRLVIPDPFELLNAVRMRNQPPDAEPPVSPPDLPRPKLPVMPPAK